MAAFPDAPADLGLKGEAVRYCLAQVHKLVDSFQLEVCDAGGWWMLHILTHHLHLFEANGKPKVLASTRKAVHELL